MNMIKDFELEFEDFESREPVPEKSYNNEFLEREFNLEFEEFQLKDPIPDAIYHDKLLYRDKPNQHPIKSIEGLEDELNKTLKKTPTETIASRNLLTINEKSEVVDSGVSYTDLITKDTVDTAVTEVFDRTLVGKVEEVVEDKLSETGTGTDKNFVYVQSTSSDNWAINHNLNKMPNVTVVDSAGSVVIGDVTYIDANNINIKFNGAFSGKAYIN